jgi:ribosome-associated heat shock protein Hsp15
VGGVPGRTAGTARVCDHDRVDATRIDKWLWAARFFKTRSLATDAVAAGHVRVNSERVKPSKDVRRGDVLEVRIGENVWTLTVLEISAKRGPASVAAALYRETPESIAERERRAADRAVSRVDVGVRPTKRERRRFEDLRRSQRRDR